MIHDVPKLNDPSLLKLDVAYVNGEWVKAKSGQTFEVHGKRKSISRSSKKSVTNMSFSMNRSRNRKVDWHSPRVRCRRRSARHRRGSCRVPSLQEQDRP